MLTVRKPLHTRTASLGQLVALRRLAIIAQNRTELSVWILETKVERGLVSITSVQCASVVVGSQVVGKLMRCSRKCKMSTGCKEMKLDIPKEKLLTAQE